MQVQPFTDSTSNSDPELWGVSLFGQDSWIDLFDGRLKRYVVVDKGGRPIARFQLYRGEKMGASFSLNAPLTPNCSLIIQDRSTKLSSSQTLEKNVHTAISEFLISEKLSVIDINLPVGFVDTQPYVWADFKVAPRYTYLLDLTADESTILSAMSASKRQNINKGLKDKLKVELTDDSTLIISLIEKAFDSNSDTFHREILRTILQSTALAPNRFAIVSYVNEAPSAVVLVVHDNRRAYYLLGGYDRQNSHDGSGSLAMWQALKESKRRGMTEFDFLGSMIPEVERYIRGFGGQLSTFYALSKRSVAADIFMRVTGKG